MELTYDLYFGPRITSCTTSLDWLRDESIPAQRGFRMETPFVLPVWR